MTLGQLISKTAIAIILFSAWKIIFFGFLNADSTVLLIFFYFIAAIIAIAVVRRFGVINYLENFLVLIIWLIASLIVDWLVVANFLDTAIFRDPHFWISYIIIISAALIFHKKRHVAIRRGEQEAVGGAGPHYK